jgi:WD40 repeat protein
VNSLALSWDEKLLYAGGEDGQVKVWDLERELLLATVATGEAVAVMTPDHASGLLATAGLSGTIKLWDAFTGRLRHQLSGHEPGRKMSGLIFDEKGKMLISASRDATVRFWSMEEFELLVVFHNMEKGFVWTTPSDAMAPFGWFWTDQPELINILDCNEDGSQPRVLAEQDPVRQEYLKMYNNREMVINRLNHYQKYLNNLMLMNQTVTGKQINFKPAALLGDE